MHIYSHNIIIGWRWIYFHSLVLCRLRKETSPPTTYRTLPQWSSWRTSVFTSLLGNQTRPRPLKATGRQWQIAMENQRTCPLIPGLYSSYHTHTKSHNYLCIMLNSDYFWLHCMYVIAYKYSSLTFELVVYSDVWITPHFFARLLKIVLAGPFPNRV